MSGMPTSALSPSVRRKPLRVQFVCDRYYAEVHAGVVDYAHSAQWALYDGKCYMPTTPYTETCDGILAIVTLHELADWLNEQTCPVVRLLCTPFLEKHPAVEPDVEAIGRRGAEHFLSIHASNCVFYRAWFTDETERTWRAFNAAIERAGGKATLFDFSEGRLAMNPILTTREERWAWLAEKLSQMPRPLAVMAEDDRYAYDVAEAANRLGWRIPEDVAILGADNRELVLKKIFTPVSSLDTNLHGIGWEGAALLDRILNGEEPPKEPIRVEPGEVKIRKSTATFMCDQPAVNAAVIHLRSHFHEVLRLEDLAKIAGLSERTLQTLFKQHVGRTVSEELSRVRLEHASRLLRETDLKLESVAHESGLRSAKYLCEVFRAEYDMTPATYRERARAKEGGADAER